VSTPTIRRRLVTALVILIMPVTACSTSDPQAQDAESFEPGAAAARIRGLGQITTDGVGRYGERTGRVAGRIGYRPYRFRVRAAVPTQRGLGWATFLGVGDEAWVERAVVTAPDRPIPLGPITLGLRGSSSPRYLELPSPNGPSPSPLIAVFDPARVLEQAAAAGATFEPARSPSTDDDGRRALRTVLPSAAARSTGLRSITVWVDGTDLPRRLAAVTAGVGEVRYDIRRRGGAFRVGAPDDAAVEHPRVAVPDATGPYTERRRTVAAGVPIRVLSAPADRGWTCWKVESEPTFRGLSDTRPSGGTCIAPLLADDPPGDRYAIPLTGGADLPYTLLGLVVPAGSVVEFRRFGNESVTVTAGTDGLALYADSPDLVPGLAIVTTPQTTLVCGPTGIDNEADFAALERSGGDGDELVGKPWNCLGAADAADLAG
jgi:hypothetical protein